MDKPDEPGIYRLGEPDAEEINAYESWFSGLEQDDLDWIIEGGMTPADYKRLFKKTWIAGFRHRPIFEYRRDQER
jgi:hypothetical protein